jgi:hypothetical protein
MRVWTRLKRYTDSQKGDCFTFFRILLVKILLKSIRRDAYKHGIMSAYNCPLYRMKMSPQKHKQYRPFPQASICHTDTVIQSWFMTIKAHLLRVLQVCIPASECRALMFKLQDTESLKFASSFTSLCQRTTRCTTPHWLMSTGSLNSFLVLKRTS